VFIDTVWLLTLSCACRLLAAGAEVNARNHAGNTPLHIAVIKQDKKMIDLLIANGADLKTTNGDGNTPVRFSPVFGVNSILNE